MRFIDSQNMSYLKHRLQENLPNFYKKYNNLLKYELEGDNDKQRIFNAVKMNI